MVSSKFEIPRLDLTRGQTDKLLFIWARHSHLQLVSTLNLTPSHKFNSFQQIPPFHQNQTFKILKVAQNFESGPRSESRFRTIFKMAVWRMMESERKSWWTFAFAYFATLRDFWCKYKLKVKSYETKVMKFHVTLLILPERRICIFPN